MPISLPARTWALAASTAAPFLRVALRRRVRAGKEIEARLGERFGLEFGTRPTGKLVWLHAASVGETLSVFPVLQAMPAWVTILFTTGTVTSARVLEQRLPELSLNSPVLHRFAPLDVPRWVARFLDHWKPDLAAFVESEIWPNTLAECRARHIPAVLLNARMSVRSAARWCNVPGFARELLGSFAWIAAQSDADAARLISLGGHSVASAGNLKFSAEPLPADHRQFERLAGVLMDRPRWLAASTHPGDEQLVVAAHRSLATRHPGLVTAIVPRHPERGAAIAAEFDRLPRRSLGADPAPGIWIADTLGELGLWYRIFPIVFMGKSFPPGGGQNPLEPARLGCAVAAGPAMQNFADATTALAGAGGLTVVANANDLTDWVDFMLRNPEMRTRAGAAARAVADAHAELPARLARQLLEVLT